MHSRLPLDARRALRLVNRAARDAVDGRCTQLFAGSRLGGPEMADTVAPLVNLAPRLAGLASLTILSGALHNRPKPQGGAAIAEALRRLPRPGTLTELQLALSAADPDAAALCVAAGRFTALRRLSALVAAPDLSAGVATSFAAVLRTAARAPALASLSLGGGHSTNSNSEFAAALAPAIGALPLWGQLEALELRGFAAALLPMLSSPGGGAAAARLGRLRYLHLQLSPSSAAGYQLVAQLPQLSRLVVAAANAGRLRPLLSALEPEGQQLPPPPPPLRALRVLELDLDSEWIGQGLAGAADVRRLLAAANPATLEELRLNGLEEGDVGALARRAGALAGLRALAVDGADLWGVGDGYEDAAAGDARAAAGVRALRRAALAPLTRLGVASAWLVAKRARLAALLSAPWAASLVELRLSGSLREDGDSVAGAGVLRALSGLPHLRALRLDVVDFARAAAERAQAAERPGEEPAAAWARRLVDFELVDAAIPRKDTDDEETLTLAAVAALPFENLKRLSVGPFLSLKAAHVCAFAAAAPPPPPLAACACAATARGTRPAAAAASASGAGRSVGGSSVTAVPAWPARPVRPTRWT